MVPSSLYLLCLYSLSLGVPAAALQLGLLHPEAPHRVPPARSSRPVCAAQPPDPDGSARTGGAVVTTADSEIVGNLVADDEWLGLAMEMAILVRVAVREGTKKQVKAFTGKDDYKVGDVSKELDSRVKAEVARLREKDEYELGDLSIALDKIVKVVSSRHLTHTKRHNTARRHPPTHSR